MHTLMTSMITVSCRVERSFQHYFPVCSKSKFSIMDIENEIHLVLVLGVLEAGYNCPYGNGARCLIYHQMIDCVCT